MKRNTFPLPPRFNEQTSFTKVREVIKYPMVSQAYKRAHPELQTRVKTTELTSFETRPYQLGDILPLLREGGWFDYTAEFESESVATFARQAQEIMLVLWRAK